MLNLASISFNLGSDLRNLNHTESVCSRLVLPSKPCVLEGHNKLTQSNAVNGVRLLAAENLEEHVLNVEEGGLMVALLTTQHHCILVLAVVLHWVGRPAKKLTNICLNISGR